MKTTLEIPDDVGQAMKIKAAVEGIKLRTFLEQAVRLRLESDPLKQAAVAVRRLPRQDSRHTRQAQEWLKRWRQLGRR